MPMDRDACVGAVEQLKRLLKTLLSAQGFEREEERILSLLSLLKEYQKGEREYAIPRVSIPKRAASMSLKLTDITRDLSLIYRDGRNVRIQEFFDEESMKMLATQFTLRDSELYLKIKPCDLINNSYKRGSDPEAERRIEEHKAYGNTLHRWAIHTFFA